MVNNAHNFLLNNIISIFHHNETFMDLDVIEYVIMFIQMLKILTSTGASINIATFGGLSLECDATALHLGSILGYIHKLSL